jgi:predicted CoA-binding protein
VPSGMQAVTVGSLLRLLRPRGCVRPAWGIMACMTRWDDPVVSADILRTYRSWAVVGCSDDPRRASYGVASFLQQRGYDIVCINPNHDSCIEGAPCYPDLLSVEEPVEVVDIFRRSELVEPHVEEAIRIGAKAIWMQLGVINERAAERAAEAGLKVVMDRCPKIDLG